MISSSIHAEIARQRHADVLREARERELVSLVALGRDRTSMLHRVRGLVQSRQAPRPAPIRPVVSPT